MPLSEIPLEDYIDTKPATSRSGQKEWIGDLLDDSELQQIRQGQPARRVTAAEPGVVSAEAAPTMRGSSGRSIESWPVQKRAATEPVSEYPTWPRTRTPAATEPVPEPATARPVDEAAPTGAGQAQATPKRLNGAVRVDTAPVRAVGRFAKSHPIYTTAAIGPAVAAGIVGKVHDLRGEGKPAGTTPTTTTTTTKGDPIPKDTKTFGDGKFPGVSLRGDPETGRADGVYDENGVYHNFPADMTDDQYLARMQEILHNQERVATQQAKGASTTDSGATAPVAEPPAAAGTAVPISTITGATDTATPSGSGKGTPLITEDGTDTGLVLNDDGTVTKSSGSSGGYRKSYSSGGSFYSRGGYSKSKKKKSSSSSSGMWEGFPFNRPNSPIRQLILDAIASSKAEGQARKGSRY